MQGHVAVGEAVRPQGVRGEVRVRPWMEAFGAYENIKHVLLKDDPSRRLEIESVKQGGKGSVIWKFKGVDSPEAAERLRGVVFLVDRQDLPGPEEGIFFWEDFEGRDAVDESGRLLGRIVDMLGTKGNDLIVIRTPDGGELLVPALFDVVLRREGDNWIFRPPEYDEDESGEGESPDAI